MTPTVDLATKVRFLSDPRSYAERPAVVEAIETHMAWVFLAGDYAYKLKKPVRYERLDYRTLEDRSHVCQEEVRLNRRLAPVVYLGVIPMTLEPGRGLSIGGRGAVVEWLVHMRRLPSEQMLDRAIARGPVPDERLEGAARLLARFYRDAPPILIAERDYRRDFRDGLEETESELLDPAFELPGSPIRELARSLTGFLGGDLAALLDERVTRIVEGHGDLRPEHVYLGSSDAVRGSTPSETPTRADGTPGGAISMPVIIDCLEFDRELRLLDPVDELAFFAMECTLLGQPAVGERFRDIYGEETGDRPRRELVRFYETFRAFLRAKIAIWHLRDDGVTDHPRWRERALRYLEFGRKRVPQL